VFQLRAAKMSTRDWKLRGRPSGLHDANHRSLSASTTNIIDQSEEINPQSLRRLLPSFRPFAHLLHIRHCHGNQQLCICRRTIPSEALEFPKSHPSRRAISAGKGPLPSLCILGLPLGSFTSLYTSLYLSLVLTWSSLSSHDCP
jgi:hypothetical protein